MSGFSIALSALSANTTAIETVGHNLANLSTTGYKQAQVSFSDMMNNAGGSGAGVGNTYATRVFSQGGIVKTSAALNAAVQGSGFFAVHQPGSKGSVFTRDGHFQLDNKGYLVALNGARVQGWNLNTATGIIDVGGPLQDILVPVGAARPAQATSAVTLSANLDASAVDGSSLSVPVKVYDATGVSHDFTMKFTKTAANTWSAEFTTQDPTVEQPLSALTPASLTFENGTLAASTPSSIAAGEIKFTAASGLPSIPAIDFSLWQTPPSPGPPPVAGVSNLTQLSQPSATMAIEQNGGPAATVTGARIADDGKVFVAYSDGRELQTSTLALAFIRNPESLTSVGNNQFQVGSSTTAPQFEVPGKGIAGTIMGQSLEGSNVDIAEEFTKLISFQRSYQANSRVITTTDELTQEALSIKR